MNGYFLEKYITSNLFHVQVMFCEWCVPGCQDQIYHIPHAFCSNTNVKSNMENVEFTNQIKCVI